MQRKTSAHGVSIGRRTRTLALGVVTALLAAIVPGALLTPASAADPTQVNLTLQGCRNDGSITLPDGSGKFICPDGVYTGGNLGKGWNELDLVPFRFYAATGNGSPATQTYTVAVVLDAVDAGRPGYDVISAPQLNVAKSDASCTAPSVSDPQGSLSPGIGGTDTSIYRLVTITQPKNQTCRYDYYGRLALGSHLYPGSSLHANLTNEKFGTAGVGAQDVPIPVKEILPQELSKDMSASQGSDHTWNITKKSEPASVNLGNTCDISSGEYASAKVDVTVEWTRNPANPDGPVTITTNIYATNPAARTITVNATDKIYAGSGQTTLLDTFTTGAVDVPANTKLKIGTHSFVWNTPSGTTVNDVATATYTDKVTGVAVPGSTSTSASATIQNNGPVTNASATISDTESITGSGLTFSVAAPSAGAFVGYTAGTKVTGPVDWELKNQTSSGTITFAKTVYAAKGSVEADGKLSDTAAVTGSDGFKATADASTSIAVDTKASLTINKSIPNVLQTGESATFNFKVRNSGGDVVATPSISFAAGETSKSTSVSNLPQGNYQVSEDASTGWKAQPAQSADLTGVRCTDSVSFQNEVPPASARVKKVTIPAGFASGWTFDLYQGNTKVETATTTGTGYVDFSTSLNEGSYTVVERGQDGWTSDGGSTGCSFTVNFPADAGKTYSCDYTNTYNPSIKLTKTGDDLSKIGDYVKYNFTLDNTSSAGGAAGAPQLVCTIKDPQISYNSGAQTLAAGAQFQASKTTSIPQGASDPYVNEASATCTYSGLTAVVASSDSSWSTNLFQPSIKVTKSGPTYAKVGDTITYTVKIENTSSTDSPDLQLAEFKDTLVASAVAASDCSSLVAGTSCTFTYDYTVQAGDYTGAGSTINNTASVLFNPKGFPNEITGSSTWTVKLIKPSFTITKDCLTNNIPAGASAIFGVAVTNNGDVPLNIVLSDSVALTAANTSLAVGSYNATLTFAAGQVSFSLPAGQTVSLEVSVIASGSSVVNDVSAKATLDAAYGMPSFSVTKEATAKCDVMSGATRTIGFWRTHLAYTTHVLDQHTLTSKAVNVSGPLGVNANGTFKNGGYIDLGWKKLYSVQDVMGILWADTSKQTTGAKRNSLCQARVITSKQLVGAILNTGLDNALAVPNDLIAKTITALAGTDVKKIKSLGTQLDAYNNAGDDIGVIDGDGTRAGPASPQAAEAYANKAIANC